MKFTTPSPPALSDFVVIPQKIPVGALVLVLLGALVVAGIFAFKR